MILNLDDTDIKKAVDLWVEKYLKDMKRISDIHTDEYLTGKSKDLYVQVDYIKEQDHA